MRVLGLDYGAARCGCALADPTGTIVTPIEAIERPATRRGLDVLAALVAEREVERVVVGLPLSLRGGDSEQTRETRKFVARLARRLGEGVPVDLHDERLTTRMAQRMGAHPSTHTPAAPEDSRAAALMLESWLRSAKSERRLTSPSPSSQGGGTDPGGGTDAAAGAGAGD
jgi:putative holliday junction resolvase